MSLLGRLAGAATTVMTAPVAVTAVCANSALQIGAKVAAAPGLDILAGESMGAVAALAKEMVGGSPSRRCWRNEDRWWIEVRGLGGETGRALGRDVVQALLGEPGVRTAGLNHALSRVVVTVDEDAPPLDRLCRVIATAERNAGVSTRPASDLPADRIVLKGKLIGAAANTVGLCAAATGRVLRWPGLPSGLAGAVTTIDYQPKLRAAVEDRLGTTAADTAIALAAATVYTLTETPSSLAVEAVRHLTQAAESFAFAQSWRRREPDLATSPHDDHHSAKPRPCPLPPGPIERHLNRSGRAQGIAAAAVGVATRNLNTAATAAMVATPKAARNAREGFAATLGRGLADRHGVIALDTGAIRRLDRVDAVVVDPRTLLTDRLRIGRTRGVADGDRAAVWQWAQDNLARERSTVGWHRAPLHANGDGPAQVLIRHECRPLAAPVLREIRRGGAELVSVDADDLDDLRSSFDELVAAGESLEQALAEAVRELQRQGRVVAVLSTVAAEALSAADVAIGLLSEEHPPPWPADLLAPDLAAVWRIAHALPAARRASRQGVELATSASMLGGLLMVPGVRGRGPGPVTVGAAAGLMIGTLLARGALGDDVPNHAPELEWHAMTAEQVQEHLPPPRTEEPQARSRLSATATASAGAVQQVAGPAYRLARDLTVALRRELADPLTPVLAVGSAASALLGSPVDAVLVGSVLTGNAVLAASQQVRAERLLSRLLAVQDPPARRLTDGREETVDAARLRPGDLIDVRPGEVVPADSRIIHAADTEVDESSLTGESLPVPKQVAATPGAAVAERSCMLHAGTTVVAGTAVAVVTAVGARTQANRAAQLPSPEKSAVGLQSQLKDLTNRALPFSLAGGALVTGLGVLRLAPLRRAVSSGVAVAVAAVPEGLPLVATLAQQAAARRLTRAGVLVRSPRSVEALGRVGVVCFDKTGTLSENRLRVARVHAAPGVDRDDVLACAARATPPKNGERHEHATDAAVIAAGPPHQKFSGATYLPFRSGRPFSASLDKRQLCLKGAPEVVLAACGDTDPAVSRALHEMAGSGLRVIAVARRTVSAREAAAARRGDDALAGLCRERLELVGLLGLSDTPRAESAPLLKALRQQRIGVRLLTGDHPITATAIAAELGMAVTADQVISGADWDAMSRRAQEAAVRERLVFARMTPEHKVQVVQTLERIGQVCAMVGDGANDAAAIRSATVGIGVAARGSDPARTAADVMLLDGHIGALVDALDEGRQLWRRVQAAVAVLLGGNAGEVAFSIIGSALTGSSPLNARQLLLVNMMTDALPAAALAVSPAVTPSDGAGPNQAALWRTVAIRGTTTAAAATTAWLMAGFTLTPRRASTVSLIALVSTQLGQTLLDSHSPLVVGTALGSLAALGAVISTPGISQMLGCTPLGPLGWAQAITIASAATLAAGVGPRLLGHQSSMSTTPNRHSTAYSSRSGTASNPDTTATGSEDGADMSSTLPTVPVERPNSP
ncbi:H+-transporting ATPase [Mycolicibacterium rutilum]|uniref:H+-transporting ATPase n=1 Tax=Mycolicibacterium rutilum TaxID=370526 RepID=A0A1H6LL67_MYCRU|nr:cation-translocating P-type ATPase [Mycolicibacterium rutilum]SEH89267.1 H+-transporting ATPase [Mycolicibacterium rutilum]